MVYRALFIGLGGFIGTLLRYFTSFGFTRILGSTFPYGTLVVNIVGCFTIGLIMELCMNGWNVSNEVRLFLMTGVLGGLTTFSSFGLETMGLYSNGKTNLAILNLVLNVVLSLISVWLGKFVINFR